jgi:hypothetical protein
MKPQINPIAVCRILFLALLLRGLSTVAQEPSSVYINPKDPEFLAKYKDIDFAGKFSVLAVSDEKNNYFIADFAKLPSQFEKVYFINLVFGTGKVVNIDSDLSSGKVWFLANKKYSASEIGVLLDQLKEKTGKANSTFTDEQKEDWLKKNDKYKTKTQ